MLFKILLIQISFVCLYYVCIYIYIVFDFVYQIKEADKNGDGAVDKQEFADVMMKTNIFS